MTTTPETKYTKKDFQSDQEVRWCPGCGDYSILSSLQLALVKTGVKKEDIVCVSGIGCSSRFPYYMGSYGYHTIHGRAPGFATGIKTANPSLSVWLITGDGDGLSIGGNHLIHVLRRNVDLNIILFNNEIYGLTKGQYSPTSKKGKVAKSTPYGSVDRAFNPGALVSGAGSTYIARTLDTDPKHMIATFLDADKHRGTSFIEVYQNCIIFNDKIHEDYTNRKTRNDHAVFLEHGEPMIFGKEVAKGLILEGIEIKVVEIGDKYKESDLLVHDRFNKPLSTLLLGINENEEMPKLLGVIYQEKEDTYEVLVHEQIEKVKAKKKADFKALLHSGDTWEVK
jgi:2-oxoglutarate/2-oxoacid ferredoxin oxidoreductase subunit beta